jgi:hypothetical protein
MTLFISNSDTMIILLKRWRPHWFHSKQDSTGTDVIYSNQVSFKIENTDEKQPYIQIEKEAKGKSLSEAKKREKIKYAYTIMEINWF